MLFGLIALFASGYCFVSRTVLAMNKKRDEYSAVVALLLHIRAKLSSGGGSLYAILRGFESEPLSKNGLLGVLRADAVGNVESSGTCEKNQSFFRDNLSKIRFVIEKDDAKKLLGYLESYGKCYIEEERRKLSEITDHFMQKEKWFCEKNEKDIKALWIVFTFLFVGVLIFLI